MHKTTGLYKILTIILIFLLATSLVACSNTKNTGQSAAGNKTPIKIGVLFSETGPISAFAKPNMEGALLAIDTVNKQGGINGRQLEAVKLDDESKVDVAIAQTKKLAQDGVVAIVGPATSGLHNSMIPTIEQLKVPVVSISGGMGSVKPIPAYSFTTNMGGLMLADALGAYWKELGIKKFALLTTSDSTGESALLETDAMAKKYGIERIAVERRAGSDSELSASLSKLLNSKPDAVFLYASPPTFAITALNSLGDLGYKGPIAYIGASRLTSILDKVTKSVSGNIAMSGQKVFVHHSLKNDDPVKKKVDAFGEIFKAAKGNDEDQLIGAALGYDGVMQVVDAIKAVGDDRDAIRKWLTDVKNWPGSDGFTINRGGEDRGGISSKDAVIFGLDPAGGKFKLIKYFSDIK